MDWLHPDGDLTDTERARKRGITLSNQQYDGMSRLSGYLTPQARATFEAVLAKLAAPGATNPDDHTPVIDTTPDAAAIDRDTRSQAQRNHDGLLAGLRALIASGKLGQHNGLPVSIVVTTTLTDLQTGAGKGFTGGGTLLPMADVIRMTSHAHHYSPASGRYPQAIFDHGTPLALYHTKRLASPAQRIMLFANDRGCTKPGCDAPAYHSQAHHVTGLDQHRTHRHHRADPGLRPRQPTRRKRLDHPQQHPRPHRMATTTPPRPRPTPHQHLPPPRTIPPQPRRRRQTRLTPEREPHGAHAPPGPPCSHKPQRPGALTTTHQPFCKAAGVCPRRCGPSPLEQSVGIARLLMAWTARSRAKRCRHDSTASAHRCPRRESMNTWASAAPVAHGLPRWPARLVICVGSPSPARLSRLLGASGSAGRRGGNIHR